MRIAISCGCLLAAVWHPTNGRAENWPQWRGPAGSGVSGETDVPLAWSAGAGVAWKATLPGPGASTPAIWGAAIFVTSQQGENLLLSRIDKATGHIVWTKTVGTGTTDRKLPGRGKQKFHELHNLASPSPATDGKTVIAHFGNGDLAAYDFDGRQLWKRNLQDDHGRYTIWWGHANSPVIAGDLVISVCMQDPLTDLPEYANQPAASYVVAHELATGRKRWHTPRDTGAKAEEGDSYTTPLLHRISTEAGAVTQLIIMGANQLDAYDPATGKQLWFLPRLMGNRTITGPTIADGHLYSTRGMRGAFFSISLDEATETAAKAKPDAKKTDAAVKVPNSVIDWEYRTGTPDSCSPVVWGEFAFIVTDDGIARCLTTKGGVLKWQARLKGSYKASPVAADGRIYFLNTSGLCTVVAAAARFEKLTENQLDDETIASPAISDGRVFLRGKKFLYAIEK